MRISEDEAEFYVGIVAPNGEIIEHSTDWDSARDAATSMGEFFASPKAALQQNENPVDAAREFIVAGIRDLEQDDFSKMPLTLTAAAFVVIHTVPEHAVEDVRAVLIATYEEKLSLLCFNSMEQYEKACAHYTQQSEPTETDDLGVPPTPTLH